MAKIFVDYGHYNNDVGAVGNGLREVDINVAYGRALARELSRHNQTVRIGGGGSLTTRVNESNNWGSDLFISCHTNAGGGDGFEAFVSALGGNAERCANAIYDQVVNVDKLNNGRGVKTANFTVITKTNCPAVLTECAFIDTVDIRCVDEAYEQERFGIAIAKGILRYLGVNYIPESEGDNNVSTGGDYYMKVYKNGSTKEITYETDACTTEIGYLDPYEVAECIGEFNNKAVVKYTTTNGQKVGWVKWLGGIQK